VNKTAPKLTEEKVLKPAVLEEIKKLIHLNELSTALQQIKVDKFNEKLLLTWKEGKIINESMLKNLTNAVECRTTIDEISRKISNHEEYIKQVFQNQARLRENIRSMEKVSNSSLVERYLKDLNQEEDNLIKARQSIENLDKQKREQESQLKSITIALVSEATKSLETLE